MNDLIPIENQKKSILSQSGIMNVLNANILVNKEQVKSLNSSKSFEYVNFQDINNFKEALSIWNQNIGKDISKSEENSTQLNDNSKEAVNELLSNIANDQNFQKILVKRLLDNKELLNKIKKSL